MKRSNTLLPFLFFSEWGDHVHFVGVDGTLFGFGSNNKGELGIETTNDTHIPTKVPFFKRGTSMEAVDVSHGVTSSYFLTKDKKIRAYSCGLNHRGRLSISKKYALDRSTAFSKPLPIVLSDSAKNNEIVSIKAGCGCVYLLMGNGSVYSCGNNACGQLGHGDVACYGNGTKIKSLEKEFVVEVSVGYEWVIFAAKGEGFQVNLYGCGSNSKNEIHKKSPTTVLTPVKISCSDRSKNLLSPTFLITLHQTGYYLVSTGSQAKPKYDVYVRGGGSFGEFGDRKEGTIDFEKSEKLSGCDLFCTGNCQAFLIYRKNNALYGCGMFSLFIPNIFCIGWSGVSGNSSYSTIGHLSNYGEDVTKRIEGVPANDVVQIVTSNLCTFIICSNGDIYGSGCFPGGKSLRKQVNHKKFTLLQKGMKIKKRGKYLERIDRKERLDFLSEKFLGIFLGEVFCNLRIKSIHLEEC